MKNSYFVSFCLTALLLGLSVSCKDKANTENDCAAELTKVQALSVSDCTDSPKCLTYKAAIEKLLSDCSTKLTAQQVSNLNDIKTSLKNCQKSAIKGDNSCN